MCSGQPDAYSLAIIYIGASVLSRVKGTQMTDVLSAQGTSFIQLISSMGQPSPGHGVTRGGDWRLPSRNSAGQGDTCGASVDVYAFKGFPGERRGVGVPCRMSRGTRWARALEVA